METSPGNFQAWLNHGRVLPRAESTAAARALAEHFGGDRGAADWRHFGRLAGLTNRKPRYESSGLYPFVRLVEASGQPYAYRQRFVDEVSREIEIRRKEQTLRSEPRLHVQAPETKSIEFFRARPAYAGDNTRADLAYSVYALAHGVSENVVRDALRSRDLRHKGTDKRQAEYVERTLKKAYAALTCRAR
ncbi:MAG: hypothetical protein JNK87_03140 [Bryobacterales bacterium]|nr:hypothetical protein [Bryobacterales bacterium]